ncbi:peptidase [Parapedobacter sp. SGR-10]|uniref:M14 family metallopeptidase n=1 Tax=Parapedobacter sp. SGR-10 TaxID=2710879 RepID=UPI0013D392A9|nr:M14 metallopeptidase family protein [Parapedobacter sp. SGR-10]NGF56463.1 peptidase [Parapedobacter sp. SGR-10]
MKQIHYFLCAIFLLIGSLESTRAQSAIPTPKSHFGFNIGDDYHLTNYTQTEAYFKRLAELSDRVLLKNLGHTEEGRNQYMLVVSSPENIKNVEQYRAISQELALAKMPEETARKLSKEGKAVVWIDGGLHSTETVATHQLIETVYQMVSRTDDEATKILENVVILFVHANPDGHELMGNWYMREKEPTKRVMSKLPVLYQKYIGHDNNRDFFMFNMAESRNLAQPLFVDWIPQIVYNHHQSAPAGTVVVGPPYRDPFNYVYDPILVTSLDAIGAAMHTRLNVEDKPGYGQRGSSRFSTWWNGGLRTSVYFHNMIGILTEIIGGPNPSTTPLIYSRILPNGDSPNPVHPQTWNFKKSIDYSVSLNMAVLHYAANNKEDLLYNIYKMGHNSIKRGSEASLAIHPGQIRYMKEVSKIDTTGKIPSKWYDVLKEDKSRHDPIAYVIPSNQPDFGTAIKFINRLILSGIEVERADKAFALEGKNYPAGSYVVRLAQAFRPHILDMFEPQNHPDDFEYAGGPPIPPYDAAGWTLAYTMGVKFDRIQSPVSQETFVSLDRGKPVKFDSEYAVGGKYLQLSTAVNDNFKLLNAVLKAGGQAYTDPKGYFYIENSKANQSLLNAMRESVGYKVVSANSLPKDKTPAKALRIALWDTYGGSMKSGWMRWLLEDFNYDFDVIYNPDIDRENLREKYDVILFPGGGVNASLKKKSTSNKALANIPEEYKGRVGEFSSDHSLPAIQKFVNEGGKLLLIGSSSHLAKHLGIPQKNALSKEVNGKEKPLSRQEFYIPGSVMTVKVSTEDKATSGLEERVDVYFGNSPVFKFDKEAEKYNVKTLLTFDSPHSMKSGWAWGQHYLNNTVAAYRADLGKGKVFVFGPEVAFRSQTHSTFRLIFNQLY